MNGLKYKKIVVHRVTFLLENENSGYCYHL